MSLGGSVYDFYLTPAFDVIQTILEENRFYNSICGYIHRRIQYGAEVLYKN